jgi:CRP-like cAMP-binding protein
MPSLLESLDWHDLPGHAAYILIAISYLLTSMLWLRVVAIAGLLLEIAYFALSGGNLWAGIGWGLIFVAINVVHLAILLRHARRTRRFGADLRHFAPVIDGLESAQVARLLATGRWELVEPGETVIREGDDVADLRFICEGAIAVTASGRAVGALQPGQFVGGLPFAAGERVTMTATASDRSKIFRFDLVRLRKLMTKDPQIAAAIYREIGRALCGQMQARLSDQAEDATTGQATSSAHGGLAPSRDTVMAAQRAA